LLWRYSSFLAVIDMVRVLIFVALIIFLFLGNQSVHCLYEGDRVEEYHRRKHVWPPLESDYIPNTKGWRKIFQRRFSQLNYIEDSGDRYNGYMSTVYGAVLGKNFTENGWGLTKAPAPILQKLKESLKNGMSKENIQTETDSAAIETDNRPLFIDQNELNREILLSLLPLHEAWAGVSLVPNNAYGLRVYRNESSLNMHVDKTQTHIISSILHVSHDESMENWPIIIEDFQGNTNEVYLEDGDMLFYESSKCLHGRPKKMNGEWYTSLFIHYYPTDWDANKVEMDSHYRIPPGWNNNLPQEGKTTEDLVVRDTSVKEPSCENEWCSLANSVKVYGPAPGYGKVLTTGNVVHSLQNIPGEEHFYSHVRDDL